MVVVQVVVEMLLLVVKAEIVAAVLHKDPCHSFEE